MNGTCRLQFLNLAKNKLRGSLPSSLDQCAPLTPQSGSGVASITSCLGLAICTNFTCSSTLLRQLHQNSLNSQAWHRCQVLTACSS